tara:strand:+ start:209 stop:460 length:252 start_codon:yes stop_codon:yes gene_type:complete
MSIRENWNTKTKKFLVGKTVKTARYLTKEELIDCFGDDTYKVPLVIEFTDGSWIFPMSDDEGNDGGALATSDEAMPTIPVIRI